MMDFRIPCVVDTEATNLQCFTILWQQPGIQALQVRNTRDEWIDAPPKIGRAHV